MLQKTEMSEVSTNAETRTTSFFTSKNRQMYRRHKKGQTSPKKNPFHQFNNQDIPNDLLFLTPSAINTLSWPSIYLFDNDITAAIKGNFYEISGLRGKKKFLPRNSEPNSELVHFWAQRPTQKLNLIAIQRYFQQNAQLYLHINLIRFNPSTNIFEISDFYLNCKQEHKNKTTKEVWDFCSFEAIDQCRKGILIVKVYNSEGISEIQYKVMLVELVDRKKNLSKQTQAVQKPKLKLLSSCELNCQLNMGRQKQNFLKTIKSQFGDIVLVITNTQIYEVENDETGDSYKMNLKPYKLSKSIANSKNNYFKLQNHQQVHDSTFNTQEEILDVRFMSNGLKLMILTNHSHILVIQAHNFLFSQQIAQLFSAQNFKKYKIQDFEYTKLYPVNGSIAVQFNSKSEKNLVKQEGSQLQNKQHLTKGILILKAQNNSLSLGKVINLQIQQKDIQMITVRECQGLDQILIQYIQKKFPYVVQVIKCRILMAELNSMSKLTTLQYNYTTNIDLKSIKLNHFHPQDAQKKYLMAEMPLSNRVIYLLNEKQLTCYKIFSQLDGQKTNLEMTRTLSTNFFQKAVKITVSPLTGHFIIIFRQFVKFFFFNYSSIKNYYTLKIKNIVDAKYICKGQKVLLTGCDGQIYLIDAYNFRQQQILEFYGQPTQADMIDQKHLIIKSHKNFVSLFRSGWDQSQSRQQFCKIYQIKVQEGDLYTVDKQHMVVFKRNASIQVYSHQPLIIPNNLPQSERQCYEKLKAIHPNLTNKAQCTSFKQKEYPIKMLLTEQLGFILVATNKGNIKQYLWPLQAPTNPNPPEVTTQQVSTSKILNLFLDAKLTYLYTVAQDGAIIQLQVNQYINGEEMPYVYIFNEKTRNDEMQKRQFTDRTYFIDSYTATQMALTQACQQSIDQLEFFIDKIKDDIQQMTKNMSTKWKAQQKLLKINSKTQEKDFHIQLKQDEASYKSKLSQVKNVVEEQQKLFENQKKIAIQEYQKQLLALYKESDRLKGILKSQNDKLTQEKHKFIRDFESRMKILNQQKEEQVIKLLKEYEQIEEKRRLAIKQNQIFQIEQQAQMQLYKSKIHQQEQQQLDKAEEQKERLLGENTKKEKQINNLKHRSNYFQNLILQTNVQIAELTKDQQQYQNKKDYLQEELKDKEDIIQKIQRELVQYLKNTEDMKTIKNNHEFQLEEYEKQVYPISQNFNQIQTNVKHMNQQIMKQYTLKVSKTQKIETDMLLIEKLKETKKKSIIKKLQISGKFNRIAERLTYLATHPFDGDVKRQLKQLLQQGDKSVALMKMDEAKQKQKREGQKLIRYKNMIRKQIEEQEKRQQHVVKNQHEFYKYHNQNTALVRQFNMLKKDQKYLQQQLSKLTQKVNLIKMSLLKTPMKRIPSLNLRKINETKLTPFQKYEQQQKSIVQRKIQETTDTKVSRNSQSLSFLKGLMKQLNTTESKNEKIQVMRERVRTFVNPEIKGKTQQIKKLLFGRSRGASEMLKLV